MKLKKAILPFIVLFLVGSMSFVATAKAVSFPNLPATPVTLTSILHDTLFAGPPPYDTWYFDNILSGIIGSYDVSDGTYTPSWCVDRRGMSIPSGDLIYLYLSLSLPANPELHVQDWNRINYILNHINPSATTADIQQAIWAFVPLPPVADPTPTLISQQMINDAIANGGSFVPGPGQFVAVVCEPIGWETENLQITIIKLTVPPTTTGATRTIGFWQTHTTFTEWVFDNKLSGFIPIDSSTSHAKDITTYGQLFGAFYCSIPKNTDHSDRPGIDQNRTILLQQLVGAILNHAASGVTVPIDPATGKDLITAGNEAYSSNNGTEMLRVKDLLDSFNGSGEIIAFPPGLPPQGSATPQASKAIADKAFWNSPL